MRENAEHTGVIRLATTQDRETMADLMAKAFPEAGVPGAFSREHYLKWWEDAFTTGSAAVLLLEAEGKVVGMLASVQVNEIMTGDPIVSALHWYVLPKHRGHGAELINAFLTEARRRKVVGIYAGCMMNVPGRNVAQIYMKKGFRLTELTFSKQTGAAL